VVPHARCAARRAAPRQPRRAPQPRAPTPPGRARGWRRLAPRPWPMLLGSRRARPHCPPVRHGCSRHSRRRAPIAARPRRRERGAVAERQFAAAQSSIRKLRNCSLRLGWRSLRNALASIWRMRSRVTSNCLPTSSSVWSVFISMPKRMRSTLASRGVS
jgi:hypothetical protein